MLAIVISPNRKSFKSDLFRGKLQKGITVIYNQFKLVFQSTQNMEVYSMKTFKVVFLDTIMIKILMKIALNKVTEELTMINGITIMYMS